MYCFRPLVDLLAAQMEVGQIDMSNSGFTKLTPFEARLIEVNTKGAMYPVAVSPSNNWGLMLNVKKVPFNDARVRQAIQLAIDYEQLDAVVFDDTSGAGCPLMGMAHSFEECATWPGLRDKYSAVGKDDITKAKELMAAAGYPNGFQTTYDVRSVGTYPEQCTVVKHRLKDVLGIEGWIETHSSAAGYALFGTSHPVGQEGDWEMACQGEEMVARSPDGLFGGVYIKGATRNYTDWENDYFNEMFEKQKVEMDPAKRKEILKELELFLHSHEDNHWITLGWGVMQWMISEDIQGFHAPQTVQTHFKHEDLWLTNPNR